VTQHDLPGGSRVSPATVPATQSRDRLGTYASYEEAQRVVDRLSDGGFDVSTVQIVGCGLRTVEQVTGRLTTGRAALIGAGAGAWWGLFVGLLLSLFTLGFLGPVVVGVLVGVGFGALTGALGHAALGGKRDFTSVQGLVASEYEVLVPAGGLAEAERLLSR
jgi:hypothetical protein